MVTHPSTTQSWHSATTLIKTHVPPNCHHTACITHLAKTLPNFSQNLISQTLHLLHCIVKAKHKHNSFTKATTCAGSTQICYGTENRWSLTHNADVSASEYWFASGRNGRESTEYDPQRHTMTTAWLLLLASSPSVPEPSSPPLSSVASESGPTALWNYFTPHNKP